MDQHPVTDAMIRDVLETTRVIACVGASPNANRPSHYVSRFLISRGYRVIPVNPGHAGTTLFGETVHGRVSDIPADIPVDMIDLFRRSEDVLPIVEQAIAALPALRTVWMQLGVENTEAARLAQSHGLTVIQNRCPKIEIARLLA